MSDPHAIAWAFNIRGADVAHTPLPLAFAIIPQAGRPSLYIDGRKLSNEVRSCLETLADLREPSAFPDALEDLGRRKNRVRIDQGTAADALARLITSCGGKAIKAACPIGLMKAVKNDVEIAGARAAQVRDGAAVMRFLAWLEQEAPRGKLTESASIMSSCWGAEQREPARWIMRGFRVRFRQTRGADALPLASVIFVASVS